MIAMEDVKHFRTKLRQGMITNKELIFVPNNQN